MQMCFDWPSITAFRTMYSAKSLPKLYNLLSGPQRVVGLPVVRELDPKPGEWILDMGCGTGDLAAYIASLVGPTGHVIGSSGS